MTHPARRSILATPFLAQAALAIVLGLFGYLSSALPRPESL